MFDHPHFWRHFAAYATGAACCLVGVLIPPLAPLVGVGAGLLGAAGTSILEPRDQKDDKGQSP